MRARFVFGIAVCGLAALVTGMAAAQAPPVDFTKFTPWTQLCEQGTVESPAPASDPGMPALLPR